MPRPRKCRKVCYFPQTLAFRPEDGGEGKTAVILTVEEYEAVRLIDREDFSQEQCGEHMGVARTTVQQIYTDARKKLADALVEGLPLRIGGGDYQLCDGTMDFHSCCECFKYQISQKHGQLKGEAIMRIAVTYENGQIFQHFGHTEKFKVYDVADGKVISSQVVDTNGQGHGALAGILNALKAEVLICGGIGGGARMALDAGGIQLYGGVSGDADQAVADLLAGKLSYDPEARCSHHEQEGGHHDCGSHGNCN